MAMGSAMGNDTMLGFFQRGVLIAGTTLISDLSTATLITVNASKGYVVGTNDRLVTLWIEIQSEGQSSLQLESSGSGTRLGNVFYLGGNGGFSGPRFHVLPAEQDLQVDVLTNVGSNNIYITVYGVLSQHFANNNDFNIGSGA